MTRRCGLCGALPLQQMKLWVSGARKVEEDGDAMGKTPVPWINVACPTPAS